MKKYLALFIALVLLMSVFAVTVNAAQTEDAACGDNIGEGDVDGDDGGGYVPSSVPATTTPAERYLLGDANGDGYVTILDVTAIQQTLAGLPAPQINVKAANVNGGELEISDATEIQLYLAKFDNRYHIGELV